uniref:MAPEG family protein n=1 Tax=Globisporangium ultimum (strain ATCC 200006 / CBS 805.95 / DAOM BR144) TaxID=431595 RepID=K3WGK7_GLOUD
MPLVRQPQHGYVVLVAAGLSVVNLWAVLNVGAERRKFSVHLPQMYADKSNPNANEFNCIQRAHQNLVKNFPASFALLFTSAPFRPGIAAAAGIVRVARFVMYVRGYSTGDPEKRHHGAFGS